jgi:hypothetical protein
MEPTEAGAPIPQPAKHKTQERARPAQPAPAQ